MAVITEIFKNSDFGNSDLIDGLITLNNKKGKYDRNLNPESLLNYALEGLVCYTLNNKKPSNLFYGITRLNDGIMKDKEFSKLIKERLEESGIGNKIKAKIGLYGVVEILDYVFNGTADKKNISKIIEVSSDYLSFPMFYNGKDKAMSKLLLSNGFEEIKVKNKKYILKFK